MQDALNWYAYATTQELAFDSGRIATYALVRAGIITVELTPPRRFIMAQQDPPIGLGEMFGIEDDDDGEKIDLYCVHSTRTEVVGEDSNPMTKYSITA